MSSYKYSIYFAKKMLQANRTRNVLIIITIVLSIFFSSVMLYFNDALGAFSLIQSLKSYGTKAEAEYIGVTYDDYLKLQASGEFNELSYAIGLYDTAYEKYNGSVVHINYYEEKAAQWAFDELINGKWPADADEVVVDTSFCQNMDGISVGDSFYLETLDTAFRICGISSGNYNSIYVSKTGWDAENKFDKTEGHVYVRLDSIENADTVLRDKWEKVLGTEPSFLINYVYQYYEEAGAGILNSAFPNLALLLFIFVITLMSVYSVYYFAMLKDLKIYSLLRLQGMQKKQIQSVVRLQGGFQFLIGAPGGLVLSMFFNSMIFPRIISKVFQMNVSVPFHIINYIMAVFVCLTALVFGINRPVLIMTRLSAVQSVRFTNVKRIRKKHYRSKRFSLMHMALRNIQRNFKRSILVSVCIAMVLVVLVVNINMVESTSKYYDNLYAAKNDFVVGSEWLIYLLSNFEGLHADEEMKEDRTGFSWNDELEYNLKLDKRFINEIHEKCMQDEVNLYFFNYAVINTPSYVERIKGAIDEDIFYAEQKYSYESNLEQNENLVPQTQYYIDFSLLEDCSVKEGKLDRELFETGEYAVLIYDEELQSEPVFHAGDKMAVGSVDIGIATAKAFDPVHFVFDWAKSGIEASVREVEVMAVVDEVPEMCVVTGSNACFLPLNSVDAVNDENITLYAVTVDSEENDRTEEAVKAAIEAAGTGTNEVRYLSDAVRKEEKQRAEGFYIGIGGGVSAVLCMIAFMNLINNCMLGLVERKDELTTLHAIGMAKRQILRMLRIENCLITGAGAFLGYCAGLLVSRAYILNEYDRYYNVEQYVVNDKIPGLVLICGILLLSVIFPNNRRKIGEYERVND